MPGMTKKHAAAVAIGAAFLALLPAYLESFTIWGPSDTPVLTFGDRVVVNYDAYEFSSVCPTAERLESSGSAPLAYPPASPPAVETDSRQGDSVYQSKTEAIAIPTNALRSSLPPSR